MHQLNTVSLPAADIAVHTHSSAPNQPRPAQRVMWACTGSTTPTQRPGGEAITGYDLLTVPSIYTNVAGTRWEAFSSLLYQMLDGEEYHVG